MSRFFATGSDSEPESSSSEEPVQRQPASAFTVNNIKNFTIRHSVVFLSNLIFHYCSSVMMKMMSRELYVP